MTLAKNFLPFQLLAWYNFFVENYSNVMIHVKISKDCVIPTQFMKSETINFDIKPDAINNLIIDIEGISFAATFGGKHDKVFVPMGDIIAISNTSRTTGGIIIPFPFQMPPQFFMQKSDSQLLQPETPPAYNPSFPAKKPKLSVVPTVETQDAESTPASETPKPTVGKPTLSIVK